jgi:LDH2 family malate/lactate/ureidoglycolate dehydrogenase
MRGIGYEPEEARILTDHVIIPGERAYRERARLTREGIEIDRRVRDALQALGDGRRGG